MNMNGFSGRLSSDPATDGTAGKGMFRRQRYAVTAQTRRFGSKVTVNGWINEMVCAINPKSVIRPQRENPNIVHGFSDALRLLPRPNAGIYMSFFPKWLETPLSTGFMVNGSNEPAG